MLVVTDVSVFPSLVSVLGDDFCAASKSDFVEPQSFSLSGKRRALFLESQGGTSTRKNAASECQEGEFMQLNVESPTGGRRSTNRLQREW